MSGHPAVEFLRQALDQAEQLARALPPGPWRMVEVGDDGGEREDLLGSDGQAVLASGDVDGYESWIWRHDGFEAYLPLIGPDAVLRRVAADRQILAEHQSTRGLGYVGRDYVEMDSVCTSCGKSGEYGVLWPCRTVRLLAEAWGWTEDAT